MADKGICALAASVLIFCFSSTALADGGLWMIQDVNGILETNMKAKGLKLSAGDIFNAAAPGNTVSDAIVLLGPGSTGALISDKGLIISDHHSAYSALARLSSTEDGYLENGFWAKSMKDEIPLEGEEARFLKRVFDVTEEVDSQIEWQRDNGRAVNVEEAKRRIVEHYSGATGLECVVNSAWGGEKHFLYAYKVYTDLRLVAVPPVCLSNFGEDSDYWEWPKHSCDFALFRIYENGEPVSKEKSLKVSLGGYGNGSFTMMIGYPEESSRYASSAEIRQEGMYCLPVSNLIAEGRLEVLRRWMNDAPDVRLKYFDRFRDLGNYVKRNANQSECYLRFGLEDEKMWQEVRIQTWIDAAENRQDMWGSLIPDLRLAYSKINKAERSRNILRESIFDGSYLGSGLRLTAACDSLSEAKAILLEEKRLSDERVEKDLLEYALEQFFTHFEIYYFGKHQSKVLDRFGRDYKAMADYLWDRSMVSSEERINAVGSMDEIREDPLLLFLKDNPEDVFNRRKGHSENRMEAAALKKEYERALYWMNLHGDIPQYPDANSTMRISYGTVGSYLPHDAVTYFYRTTSSGILEKLDSGKDCYQLNERAETLMRKEKWGRWRGNDNEKGISVNFLTDNDIGGGFSGSPVLNAEGELIGLSADGNSEGLAGKASYSQFYNKSINTDIRYIMWILDKYAGMKRVVREIKFAN